MMAAAVLMFVSSGVFAQQNGSIGGSIQDTLGAVVVGASVTVVAAGMTAKAPPAS